MGQLTHAHRRRVAAGLPSRQPRTWGVRAFGEPPPSSHPDPFDGRQRLEAGLSLSSGQRVLGLHLCHRGFDGHNYDIET
jgi:hypothetical protein